MKRSDWIILIIVILIIVAIGIWTFTSEEGRSNKEGRLQAINDRIDAVKKEIENEHQSLRLTNEMKEFVSKKINQWLWVVKAVVAAMLGSIYAAFFFTGENWINSLFMTCGIVGAMGLVSAVFVSKEINVCIWGKIPRLKAKTLVCNLWRVAQMTQPIFFHMLSESVCITSVGFNRYSTLRLPAEGSLVGSPGKPNNFLSGVKHDIKNMRRFLQSAKGGDWKPGEIVELQNPTLNELTNILANVNQDYSLVYFSGHGFTQSTTGTL